MDSRDRWCGCLATAATGGHAASTCFMCVSYARFTLCWGAVYCSVAVCCSVSQCAAVRVSHATCSRQHNFVLLAHTEFRMMYSTFETQIHWTTVTRCLARFPDDIGPRWHRAARQWELLNLKTINWCMPIETQLQHPQVWTHLWLLCDCWCVACWCAVNNIPKCCKRHRAEWVQAISYYHGPMHFKSRTILPLDECDKSLIRVS